MYRFNDDLPVHFGTVEDAIELYDPKREADFKTWFTVCVDNNLNTFANVRVGLYQENEDRINM